MAPTPRQRSSGGHLVLLRNPPLPDPSGHPDPYRRALPSSWQLDHVQVLDTVWANQAQLADEIQRVSSSPYDSCCGYDGVVLTSARSVQAYRLQLDSLPSSLPPSRVPFFVVGQATADAVLALPSPSAPPAALVLGARESGTGEALAHFILAHFQSTRPRGHDPPPRLLYLTGDKNRDVLPRLLTEGGVDVCELQVYATQPAAAFPQQLERTLLRAAAAAQAQDLGNDDDGLAGEEADPDVGEEPPPPLQRPVRRQHLLPASGRSDVWLALFSPSSAGHVLSALSDLGFSLGPADPLEEARGRTPSPLSPYPSPLPASAEATSGPVPARSQLCPLVHHLRIRLAAIGPVTARYVAAQAAAATSAVPDSDSDFDSDRAGAGIRLEAVAAQPEPEELVRAILEAAEGFQLSGEYL